MLRPLIEIKNLYVGFEVFGGTLEVLDGLDLVVWPGERVGVVGEMGSGKTTTAKAIMGILPKPPAVIPKGEIFFKGKDLLKMKHKELQRIRRQEISMIFEDPTAALNPVFTIGTQLVDAIRYAQKSRKDISKNEISRQAIQAMKKVSLPDPERVFQNYPIQLSGGMRQRICIAMTLISNNELIIADEPGTSLDVTIKDQIFRLLKKLVEERNTSIILISHSLGDIKNTTDKVYVMYAGSTVEVAKTKSFFKNLFHPYSRGLLNASPRLTGEGIGEEIPGQIPEYINPPTGCRFHPRCKYTTNICKNKKPPLFKVAKDHKVACFLYKNKTNKDRG